MNESTVRSILYDIDQMLTRDGRLVTHGQNRMSPTIIWVPGVAEKRVLLEGFFHAKQLNAIAWWMRNKGQHA